MVARPMLALFDNHYEYKWMGAQGAAGADKGSWAGISWDLAVSIWIYWSPQTSCRRIVFALVGSQKGKPTVYTVQHICSENAHIDT